ncbi:MAG: hypothetical protein KBH45_19135, partial [Verrucomicrobia bacterium]|nr:hypothetical protein [Verrucomicrobiota bacterium]
QQFASIRAAGLPASPEELDRWYAAVPEASNAAVVLAPAFELLRTFPDKRSNDIAQAKLLDRREAWSAETREQIAEYVAMNGEALAQARDGAKLPLCRYPIDLTYGLEAELPHLAELKNLARAAGLRAVSAAGKGSQADWSSDVRFILQLTTTLDHEPTLLSQLVRLSLITTAVRTTERILNSTTNSDPAYGLIEAFAAVVSTNGIRLGLIGERACATPVFRMSWAEMDRGDKRAEDESSKTKLPPPAGRANPLFWVLGFFERDLSFYLNVMETNIALAAISPPANLAATNTTEQLSGTASRRGYFYSGLMLPAIARATVRDATTLAQIRLVQTALAIECYRARYSQLPETLADLMPAFLVVVPADPFTGTPLRYRRTDEGFVIYSVDRDGHDNGGLEKPLNAKFSDPTNYDLTFTVER